MKIESGEGSGVSFSMNESRLVDLSKSQRERLAFIDFRLNFLGNIGRTHLEEQFEIKAAASTRDFTLYRELCNSNIQYDSKAKSYLRTDKFQPLFKHSVAQALKHLCQGYSGTESNNLPLAAFCEQPSSLITPDINVVSVLSRAIHLKKCIKTSYASTSSGKTTREIVPLALINTGLRWHVRAYDRKRQRFGDFALTRFSKPKLIDSLIHPFEKQSEDIQWNRVVEMEILPHPSMENQDCILMDYSMSDEGVLEINIRAAQAGYFLRYWNIDCSDNHSLRDDTKGLGLEYQLCLKNPVETLYKVDSAMLAPGYSAQAL